MDSLTIAIKLSTLVPGVGKWMKVDAGTENAARRVVELAQTVTGAASGEDALKIVQTDAALARRLQDEVERLGMPVPQQAPPNPMDSQGFVVDSRSEGWPTYSWRPFVGFCFGLLALIGGLTVAGCYLGVLFLGGNPAVLAQLPGMVGALAGVMATMAPVLGIASWFRGKMQLDPRTSSDGRT
jgi:hypothetical protein